MGTTASVAILTSRNPWLKLLAVVAVAVLGAAIVGYVRGTWADALGAGLTALGLGMLTALVVWIRRRRETSKRLAE